MTDAWEERRKALENEYFHKIEARLIEQMRTESREKLVRELCRNRCPKCGDQIQAMDFRGVPLDKCPGCGGVWLGPRDLRLLSEKDHHTWFDRWFKEEK
jgi:ribosomal protein S27AE